HATDLDAGARHREQDAPRGDARREQAVVVTGPDALPANDGEDHHEEDDHDDPETHHAASLRDAPGDFPHRPRRTASIITQSVLDMPLAVAVYVPGVFTS